MEDGRKGKQSGLIEGAFSIFLMTSCSGLRCIPAARPPPFGIAPAVKQPPRDGFHLTDAFT